MAFSRLQLLTGSLDSQGCRKVAQTLESIDTNEPPIDEVLAQENLWNRKSYGIREQISLLLSYKQEQKARENIRAKDQRNQQQRRQMMITFATRAFELEKGKRPQSWTDLVPGYLKAVPKDPVTGKDMVLGP